MQSTTMREHVFNMRMSTEEWERLEALAKRYELSAAQVVRMLIKIDFDGPTKGETEFTGGLSRFAHNVRRAAEAQSARTPKKSKRSAK